MPDIKPGDSVLHYPTGENWVVAFVEGDRLAWCGWPPGLANLSDCELRKSCTEEESLEMLRTWAKDGSSEHNRDHRTGYARRRLAELGVK